MDKEKYLKSMKFEGNGEVFCRVSIVYPVWEKYEKQLKEVKRKYPEIKINVAKNEERRKGNKIKDKWGCLWYYPLDYLDGQVIEHPLENWENLKDYKFPSPDEEIDWKKFEKELKEKKKKGELLSAGVEHGFLFLRLTYLRGFENFMIDVAEENPLLYQLRDKVCDYWFEVVKRYVSYGVEIIYFGDDLGLQNSLPISPTSWRKIIKPAYKKIFSYCRKNNTMVYLHTDGYIVDIIPDLIECGVSILNPQDLVNRIENLEKLAKGKVAIDLDIDRQKITVFGKREEIPQHILKCIKTLGSEKGGLSLIWGVYPGTPVKNIIATVEAMEKYRCYWCS
ncbi:hypothetical protein J7L87_00495 [bacterium]|nr:hypothetical protein [bacterium]